MRKQNKNVNTAVLIPYIHRRIVQGEYHFQLPHIPGNVENTNVSSTIAPAVFKLIRNPNHKASRISPAPTSPS